MPRRGAPLGGRTPEYYNDLADAPEEEETDEEGIIVDVESATETQTEPKTAEEAANNQE